MAESAPSSYQVTPRHPPGLNDIGFENIKLEKIGEFDNAHSNKKEKDEEGYDSVFDRSSYFDRSEYN